MAHCREAQKIQDGDVGGSNRDMALTRARIRHVT